MVENSTFTKIFSCVRLFLVDVALVKGVIYSTLFSPYATRHRHSEIDYCIAQVFRGYMYFRSMPKVGEITVARLYLLQGGDTYRTFFLE